ITDTIQLDYRYITDADNRARADPCCIPFGQQFLSEGQFKFLNFRTVIPIPCLKTIRNPFIGPKNQNHGS
ncbi:MAG TPA: hypothetical protein VGK10_16410, partial [Prolixibacteraceae bacterium]